MGKDGLVQIERLSNLDVLISKRLWAILGFKTNNIIIPKLVPDERRTYTDFSENKPNIETGMQALFVYSDIIKSQIVGDTKAPLLSVVSTAGSPNSHLTIEQKTLDFIPLKSNRFHSASVSLRDINGQAVKFTHGVVILTLHIRERFSSSV